MLAEALIFIVSAVSAIHPAEVTPKGKYFLIETQGKDKTEDIGATEDDGGYEDDIPKYDYEVDKMIPELMTKRPLYGDKSDSAMTEENPLKPMMTKEGKTTKFN